MHIIRCSRFNAVRSWRQAVIELLGAALLVFSLPANALAVDLGQTDTDQSVSPSAAAISSTSSQLTNASAPLIHTLCLEDETILLLRQLDDKEKGFSNTLDATAAATLASISGQLNASTITLTLMTNFSPAVATASERPPLVPPLAVKANDLSICQPYRVALYESVQAELHEYERRSAEVPFDQSVRVTAVAATAAPKPTKKPEPKKIIPITTGSADAHALIDRYAGEYGLNAEVMKKIAQCESGMRPEADNGPYGGMFQFVSSTWSSNRRAMGLDPDPSLRYNAEEAIKTAAFKMSRDGYGAWPVCSRKALASI